MFVSPESSPGRNFYPRPPRGGRHHRPYSQYLQQNISIHALREEGDRWKNQGSRGGFISIHALREEGDLQEQQDALRHQISIHALREEGDVGADEHIGNGDLISIHALREEGDHTSPWNGNPLRNFYPRPPRGGRLCKRPKKKGSCRISIHALREEGDRFEVVGCTHRPISIHALREEGDYIGMVRWGSRETFLSTPSARRATRLLLYHRWIETNFYPRPPRGGRHRCHIRRTAGIQFLSTPSARRATPPQTSAAADRVISIHALREEGDACQAAKA